MAVPSYLPPSRHIVAANVRARMAWLDLSPADVAKELHGSQRALYNKLLGVTPFKSDELDILAHLFGMANPGALYEVPEGFPPITDELISSTTGLRRAPSGRSPSSGSDSSPRRFGCYGNSDKSRPPLRTRQGRVRPSTLPLLVDSRVSPN
jgi:hypothetical protein